MMIRVLGDLRADARAHFRSQLLAMGYGVDAEFAEAKLEAAERAMKESNPDLQVALARIDETHWLCMHYLNAVKRRISQRPRSVERAPGLATNPLAQPLMNVIDEVEAASRRGDDLSPRLSKSVDELRYDDAMLNDWGIHHLHLGPIASGPGSLAGRTGPLLFVFVRNDQLYFIDVLMHGKGYRPWIRRELVEIIHSNWPDAIRQYRINAVGLTKLSDEQFGNLRSKNATMFVEMKDSTVYAPLGGGYMSSGISAQALTSADWFCATVDEFQKWAHQNAETMRDAIHQQRGILLTELRIRLEFNEKGFALIETQSRSLLHSAP